MGRRAEDDSLKILAVDIETSPNLAYVWSLFHADNVGLSQLEATTEVMCFAAKWIGKPGVQFFSEYHDGRKKMIRAAHRLLGEADAVMHYNGTKFDIPHLNREFVVAGLTPPAPFKEVDLWRVVARRFNFSSSKLAHVAPMLGLEDKVRHEGFELWRKCMAGDEAAWGRMRRYNIQDVRLVEQLYGKLRPWITTLPSRELHDGADGCPACGSTKIQSRGKSYTKVSEYQRFQCQSCGSWFRATRRERGVRLTSA